MAIQQITSVQAHDLLTGESAILVDVREPAEHRQCHIASAHLVPLSALNFDPSLAAGKSVIVHCQQLSKTHPELTFLNVEGGIEAWQAAGLTVQQGQSKVLPLDRQVQLTVGTGIVAGVVLSQTVAPEWVWLAGFFGAGLLFAGATGFCGLARVLAMMPWNR